mmetsp:Transcript_50048/g.93593  ORF Transcript_50048/g.93593 Transcript_50048/m.93593 type:complete len:231 (-) Transcript_50048:3-695(-)
MCPSPTRSARSRKVILGRRALPVLVRDIKRRSGHHVHLRLADATAEPSNATLDGVVDGICIQLSLLNATVEVLVQLLHQLLHCLLGILEGFVVGFHLAGGAHRQEIPVVASSALVEGRHGLLGLAGLAALVRAGGAEKWLAVRRIHQAISLVAGAALIVSSARALLTASSAQSAWPLLARIRLTFQVHGQLVPWIALIALVIRGSEIRFLADAAVVVLPFRALEGDTLQV